MQITTPLCPASFNSDVIINLTTYHRNSLNLYLANATKPPCIPTHNLYTQFNFGISQIIAQFCCWKAARLNNVKQYDVSLCQEGAQLYNNRLEPSRVAPNAGNRLICFHMFDGVFYKNPTLRKFAIKSARTKFVMPWRSSYLCCSKWRHQRRDIRLFCELSGRSNMYDYLLLWA
jgi:hypothetical protein